MENERKSKGKSEALSAKTVSAKYVYLGIHAGKFIMDCVQAAKKSIKIVSPYLDERLIVKLLKEKAAEGVDISIITSASKESLKQIYHKNALMALYPKYNKEKSFCKCLFIKEDDESSNAGDDFVHAKFYIIDDEIAFLGSLNFTERGIFDNYELSVSVDEPKFVQEICVYFDKLFNKGFSSYNDKELSELLYPAK